MPGDGRGAAIRRAATRRGTARSGRGSVPLFEASSNSKCESAVREE